MAETTEDSAAEGAGGTAEGGPPARAARPALASLAARLASLAMVVAAAAWVYVTAPTASDTSVDVLGAVGMELLAGREYPPDVLKHVNTTAGDILHTRFCRPGAIEALASVRFTLVEIAFTENDATAADTFLGEAERAAEVGLACNPNSSLLWSVLAWSEYIKNDDTPRLHALLRQSYKVGPYDGFSLQSRIQLMLRMMPAIGDEEQAQLKDQIQWLIMSDLLQLVADLYLSSQPSQRALLQGILSEADEREQNTLATMIRGQGDDIDLPFVQPLGSRPWR